VNEIDQFAQKHHATVTTLGTSTVDGVTATGSQIVATGAHQTLTASLWADSSDRLVQADVTVGGLGKTGAVGVTATVDLSSYGSPVTITVPPSSQVTAVPYSTVAHYLGQFLHSTRRR
jgi:hypothetical protein